jgi:histidine triad (HIT) family protein
MDCVFCRIVKGEIPSQKVLDTEEILAFRDIEPAAPVHILIIPKRHIETVNHVEADDAALLGSMIQAARDLARDEGLSDSGYRLVFNCNRDGGQVVFHLHLHLMGGRPLGGMASRP